MALQENNEHTTHLEAELRVQKMKVENNKSLN